MVTANHQTIVTEPSLLEKSFLSIPKFDWALLGHATQYYSQLGYAPKETPWLIPARYSDFTKPHDDKSFIQNMGMFSSQAHELVGSAEQGFIYLLLNDQLPPGRYHSVSPCFRTDSYDELHQPWFIKLELIAYQEDSSLYPAQLHQMMQHAYDFFRQYSPDMLEIIELPDGTFDINLNSIEVGSYGIRQVGKKSYVYGTGLALPRFSVAKSHQSN